MFWLDAARGCRALLEDGRVAWVLSVVAVVEALVFGRVFLVGGVVVDAVDFFTGAGAQLHAARAAVGHAGGVYFYEGEVLNVDAVVLREVFRGEVVVRAVLDPDDNGFTWLNHRIVWLHRPFGGAGDGEVVEDVQVVQLVVAKVDRAVSWVVDLDELVSVCSAYVGGVWDELGDQHLAEVCL